MLATRSLVQRLYLRHPELFISRTRRITSQIVCNSVRSPTDWQGVVKDGMPMVHPQFHVHSERSIYSRYFDVLDRRIQFPPKHEGEEGPVYDFDVVGHSRCNFHFTVVMPFHPYRDGRKGGEVTVCKEFAHGVVAMMYTLPAGGFDPQRHADYVQCAADELNEEAQLTGGDMLPLLSLDQPGFPESKWCANRFHPFLCIDPAPDPSPRPRDAEEFIELQRMDLSELREVAKSGNMMQPSVVTTFVAIDKLAELGYL